MKVFKDIMTGDEMFADTYTIKVVGEVLFEVYGTLIAPKEGTAKIEDLGAAGDQISADRSNCIDIVRNHRLQECFAFKDKQSFQQYLKQYKQTLIEKVPHMYPIELHFFVQNLDSVLKDILKRFEGLRFFTGESKNHDALVAICEFRDVKGIKTPVFMFIKHGLKVEQR